MLSMKYEFRQSMDCPLALGLANARIEQAIHGLPAQSMDACFVWTVHGLLSSTYMSSGNNAPVLSMHPV